MLALALAFVVPTLLRGAKANVSEAALDARRRLASLEAAHRDGHLSAEDYEARKSAIAGSLLEAVEPAVDSPKSPITGIALLVLSPVFAIVMYNQIGTPTAISGVPVVTENSSAMDFDVALKQLTDRLDDNPENVDDWFMLGRTYKAMKRYAESAKAYASALELAPDEPVLLVEYAESLAFANGEPPFPEEARQALAQAMSRDPTLQKGLWLQGLDAFSMGDNATALERWQALAAQLEPGSEGAEQIAQQIEVAKQAMTPSAAPSGNPRPDADSAPATAQSGSNPATNAPAAQLTVQISLAPQLTPRVSPDDVLYVFARAHNGPPMPLAIARLTAGELPATVKLDSSMAMMPAMNLAAFPEVVVGARISKSGNATAQPGDLQALSNPVANNQPQPVELTISSVL